jgi:predicted dehydrogenase
LTAGVIRAAVIGLGWWGRKVVADLADSSDVQVVLGVDRAAEARQSVDVPTTDDLRVALDDPDVDAVVLCTPHRFHAEQIIAAADAGKHVFCEKPLATAAAEARAALDAVEQAGVRLGVGHERRFEPAVLRLREMVDSGEIGRPLVFEGNFSQDKFLDLDPGNWRLSNDEAPVGPLSATGIHLVDLAIAILGRPVEVLARLSTQSTTFENGDTLTVTLGFEKGETAMITAVLTTPFIGRVNVIGSRGWVEIRDREHPENPQGWDVTTSLRGAEPETRFYPPHPSVRANIEAFARSAEGLAGYPVTFDEMYANVCTFEAISRSAATGLIETV